MVTVVAVAVDGVNIGCAVGFSVVVEESEVVDDVVNVNVDVDVDEVDVVVISVLLVAFVVDDVVVAGTVVRDEVVGEAVGGNVASLHLIGHWTNVASERQSKNGHIALSVGPTVVAGIVVVLGTLITVGHSSS